MIQQQPLHPPAYTRPITRSYKQLQPGSKQADSNLDAGSYEGAISCHAGARQLHQGVRQPCARLQIVAYVHHASNHGGVVVHAAVHKLD
eukprot:scaffold389_cov382-Prasinococcus_capsulatus_cf.AAC.2